MIDIAHRRRWDPDQLTDADTIRAAAQPTRPEHRVPTTAPDHGARIDDAPAPPVEQVPAPTRTAIAAGCPIAS